MSVALSALRAVPLTVRRLALALAAGSSALLLGAFYFQYVEGMAPCPLCLDQRYAHGAVIALALGATVPGRFARWLLGAALGALVIGAGIAGFHVGVEQHWWAGLESCLGQDTEGLDLDALKTQLLATAPVRCDEIPWSLAGVSMAGWNGLLSLGLAAGVAVLWRIRGHGAP